MQKEWNAWNSNSLNPESPNLTLTLIITIVWSIIKITNIVNKYSTSKIHLLQISFSVTLLIFSIWNYSLLFSIWMKNVFNVSEYTFWQYICSCLWWVWGQQFMFSLPVQGLESCLFIKERNRRNRRNWQWAVLSSGLAHGTYHACFVFNSC